jgi:hypothetical protein
MKKRFWASSLPPTSLLCHYLVYTFYFTTYWTGCTEWVGVIKFSSTGYIVKPGRRDLAGILVHKIFFISVLDERKESDKKLKEYQGQCKLGMKERRFGTFFSGVIKVFYYGRTRTITSFQ